MSYYNGAANDLEALRSALISACTGEGWTLTDDILSKDTLFMRLQLSSEGLSFLGGTGISGGALTGMAAEVSFIGKQPVYQINWPATYEIFVFAAEVYLVVNYNVNFYQWAAWGKSTVEGLPGTGMWYGASAYSLANDIIHMNPTGRPGLTRYSCPGLFHRDISSSTTDTRYLESRIHTGLNDVAWANGNGASPGASAIEAATPLLGLLPNTWNSEAVLLPIRVMQARPSGKISLVADIEHARYTRIDNYTPGQTITIGTDHWKVFPWLRKDSAMRDGEIGGSHTGTLGWAIRYEGP